MKYLSFLFILLFLCSCNELRCSFVHPDDMSENQLQLCKAYMSSSDMVVNSY